jgi:hypothetical protein
VGYGGPQWPGMSDPGRRQITGLDSSQGYAGPPQAAAGGSMGP